MLKTLVYFFIFAILGFGVYYFFFSKNDNAYNPKEAGFTVKDTGNIGKIFIVSSDGQSILLERADSSWMVNKQYKVLPGTLHTLLTTLVQQTPLYPATSATHDFVIKELAASGVKVELYDRSGKKIVAFYVGGAAPNNTGTYMLQEGAPNPYVVKVGGVTGYVTSRYTYNLKDWRDRTIVNLPPDEVKSVSVQYVGNPINSFVVNNENNHVTVSADTNITKHLDQLNSRRANLYLKFFSGINCEGYLNGISGMDTLLSHKQSTIDITGMHGQHQHLDIYWMPINKRSKNMTVADPDIPDDYDADRLYAVINDGRDTVMIQHMVFKPIFRKAYEFYQKDAPGQPQQQKGYQQPKNVMIHKTQ